MLLSAPSRASRPNLLLKRFPQRFVGFCALVALLFAVPGEGSVAKSLAMVGVPVAASGDEGDAPDAMPGEDEPEVTKNSTSLAWQRTREGRRCCRAAARHQQPVRQRLKLPSQRVEVRPQALPPRTTTPRIVFSDDDPDGSAAGH